MEGIWRAAGEGDVLEVERLVGQDPGLLDAKDNRGRTPLILASRNVHVECARWLLDKGAAMDEREEHGFTATLSASVIGRAPAVKMLLERGADPTIAQNDGLLPLMAASGLGHLEVVHVLLGHPRAKATINIRGSQGRTALWLACHWGRAGVVRALLDSGADFKISDIYGTSPIAIAKQAVAPQAPQTDPQLIVSAEGRRDCVAALEVRFSSLSAPPPLRPALLISCWLGHVAGGGAGLPPLEGPEGGGCGCVLRGTGSGGQDARRGQASARGGSAGGA
jgi:ankyrin repeat protein